MRNVGRLFCISLLALIAAACSMKRDGGSSNIEIAFPRDNAKGGPINLSQKMFSLASYPLSTSSSNFSSTAVPATLDGFTCFGVNVTGSGIPVNANVDNCVESQTSYPGIFGGLIPVTSGSISLQVPAGSGRRFALFALVSYVGCPTTEDIINGVVQTNGNLQDPYFIGASVADILGDSSVDIYATWDPSNPKKMFCGGGSSHVVPFLAVEGWDTVFSGFCESFSVSMKNPDWTPYAYPAGQSFSGVIGLTAADGNLYASDAACEAGTPAYSTMSVTVSAANPMQQIWFRPSVSAGTFSITAPIPTPSPTNSQSYDHQDRNLSILTATSPNHVDVTDTSQVNVTGTITSTGGCFGPFNALLRDANNVIAPNPSPSPTGSLNLAVSGVTVYQDPSCTSLPHPANTTLPLYRGQRNYQFYAQPSAVGAGTVSFHSTSLALTAGNGLSFSTSAPAAMDHLVLFDDVTGANFPVSLTSGYCQGPYSAFVVDALGKPTYNFSGSTITIAVTAGGAGTSLYNMPGCLTGAATSMSLPINPGGNHTPPFWINAPSASGGVPISPPISVQATPTPAPTVLPSPTATYAPVIN